MGIKSVLIVVPALVSHKNNTDIAYKYLDFEKASFMKLAVDREQMKRDVVGLWEQQARAPETKRKELLFDKDGNLDKIRWGQLTKRRNNQRVNLEE